MKLVEFTSADDPYGPVFINPDQVLVLIRRLEGRVSTNQPRKTTETTIGMVGDNDSYVHVMGEVREVASLLADMVTKYAHPERVNDGTEDLGS